MKKRLKEYEQWINSGNFNRFLDEFSNPLLRKEMEKSLQKETYVEFNNLKEKKDKRILKISGLVTGNGKEWQVTNLPFFIKFDRISHKIIGTNVHKRINQKSVEKIAYVIGGIVFGVNIIGGLAFIVVRYFFYGAPIPIPYILVYVFIIGVIVYAFLQKKKYERNSDGK